MPQVGADDVFEAAYMERLRAMLAPHGLLLKYDRDRAALDLGIHLYSTNADGTVSPGSARVWLQAKGKRAETLTASDFDAAHSVPVSNLPVDTVRYWYAAPEAVYLIVYVEAKELFLACEVTELVDRAGGFATLVTNPDQKTLTLHVPTDATLNRAIAAMPSHRSMRIDGKTWRGRPLGHGYDPLRSEIEPLPPSDFVNLVDALLRAHDFRRENKVALRMLDRDADDPTLPFVYAGRLTLTYEWVLRMMTEFGYDPGSDFRIEGEPFFAHGNVLVVVDPIGTLQHDHVSDGLAPLLQQAQAQGVDQVLVFSNGRHDQATFGSWSRLPGFSCHPQDLGSITFNVLTTTMVYLEFLDRLSWRFINYL
jgi:hypothetical protein